jgi:uncharacterized protein YecE (DUF72 family)
MRTRVGTSGFDYREWRQRFYPRGLPSAERLRFYTGSFDTVELNVTFYRMPSAATFRSWRDAVPPEFRFAVKASRYLTHVRRLKNPRGPVDFLLERASLLDQGLGPILLQLPPDMSIDLDRLSATLECFPASVQVAVEPRHRSWFTEAFRSLLTKHGAALCLADRRGLRTPLWRTSGWVYVRLHEGRSVPRPCYGRAALHSWAERLRRIGPVDTERYVFFNNDARACAISNARSLKAILEPGARP